MKCVRWFRLAAAVLVVCIAAGVAVQAQTFNVLANFDGTDGEDTSAPLVQGLDGNLYGTTYEGGTYYLGSVFEITPAGNLITLYSFCSQPNCPDGELPYAGLVQSTDGNLYGTTIEGGANEEGTVFEITPTGELTTLYSFCSQPKCTDGKLPFAGLVQATNGNFYGTTYQGGAHGTGTIFEITPTGQLTTLYSFCSQPKCTDGYHPYASLVQGSNSNLYGTTYGGSAYGIYGTIFEITPAGQLTTLYSFCSQPNCSDGAFPYSGLVQASDGNFYGTTFGGGLSGAHGAGTIFKITPSGQLTTIYNFCSQFDCPDGEDTEAGLVQGSDGNLYGTTFYGGAYQNGIVFQVTTAGKLTPLYSFCSQPNCGDGENPIAGLLQATNGNFYGTTYRGGPYGDGTVFGVFVGLRPFVQTLPSIAKPESQVVILGNGLTGTTSVTFNGTTATFTVTSPTEIKATVPTGATSGKVQVTTPHGTLTSNVVFQVK